MPRVRRVTRRRALKVAAGFAGGPGTAPGMVPPELLALDAEFEGFWASTVGDPPPLPPPDPAAWAAYAPRPGGGGGGGAGGGGPGGGGDMDF